MCNRPDLSSFDVNRAMRFALYETHRFCIRLPSYVELLNEDGTPKRHFDAGALAIVVHEYCHFVHNISTVAGWTTYELFLQLLAIFSNALNEDGTCDPSRLDSESLNLLSSTIKAIHCMEGNSRLPPNPSTVVELHVVNAEKGVERVRDADIPIADVCWNVKYRDGQSDTLHLRLGAALIEEGIAFILENSLRTGNVNDYPEGSTIDSVPLYPYAAYFTLCEALCPAIKPLAATQLGVLALCTNRPGPVLLDLLRCYEKRLANEATSGVAAMQGIVDAIHPYVNVIIDRILSQDVPILQHMFKDRGDLERGAKVVSTWFNTSLTARCSDVWFDLRWALDGKVKADDLSTLLHNSLPCDIIHEGTGADGTFGRDKLLTFQSKKHDVEHSAELGGVRSLQAQISFLLNHLSQNGLEPSGTTKATCPFYSSCVLSMRENEPAACRDEPWVRVKLKNSCWYGLAVAGTIGLVKTDGEPSASMK